MWWNEIKKKDNKEYRRETEDKIFEKDKDGNNEDDEDKKGDKDKIIWKRWWRYRWKREENKTRKMKIKRWRFKINHEQEKKNGELFHLHLQCFLLTKRQNNLISIMMYVYPHGRFAHLIHIKNITATSFHHCRGWHNWEENFQ